MSVLLRVRTVGVSVLAALLFVLVAGCGSSTPATTSTGSAGGGATVTVSSPTSAATGASRASSQCAQAGSRHFQKTRLLADLGLSYGAFHRYIYTPYQAGSFTKGAPGRTKAILKAGVASAAIVKLVKNASANAAADPTLCKYVPSMNAITSALGSVGPQLATGGLTGGGLAQTQGLFSTLKSVTGFGGSSGKLPGLS